MINQKRVDGKFTTEDIQSIPTQDLLTMIMEFPTYTLVDLTKELEARLDKIVWVDEEVNNDNEAHVGDCLKVGRRLI
jgi:hypothetical protein